MKSLPMPKAYAFNSDNKEHQKKCLPGIFYSYLAFWFHFTTKLHKVWRQWAVCKKIIKTIWLQMSLSMEKIYKLMENTERQI